MNKPIFAILIASILFNSYDYHGSTTASVVLSGAIIKAQHTNIEKKYKRKDCPVCKGTGWYISGDKITKVNCGYCEPEKAENASKKVAVPPPIFVNPNCNNGKCSTPIKK